MLAGLGLSLADWLATGIVRVPWSMVLAILLAGLLGGCLAAALALVVRRRGFAFGLVTSGGLLVHALSSISKEFGPLPFGLTTGAVLATLATAVTAWLWYARSPRAGAWAFLPLAAVPGASLLYELAASSSRELLFATLCLPPVVGLVLLATRRRQRPVGGIASALACVLLLDLPVTLGDTKSSGGTQASPTATPPAAAPNIVLVVIDTLRQDHIGATTHPTWKALTTKGVVFEQAISTAPWTLPSVASILTSLYPSQHGALSARNPLPSDTTTLAEILWEHGYQTAAFTGGAFVSPGYRLDQGFQEFDHEADFELRPFRLHVPLVWRLARNRFLPQRWLVRWITDEDRQGMAGVRRAAERWLEKRDPARPFFLFLHSYEAHDYYLYHPDTDEELRAREDELSEGLRGRLSVHPSELVAAAQSDLDWFHDVYRARIRSVDEELGAFLSNVAEGVPEEDLIVAVTSDHGEGFDAARGRVHHGGRLHDDLLRVPLVIQAVGRLDAGRVVEHQVSTVDVLPTLLDLAGIERPAGLSGQSLVDPLRGTVAWPQEAWSEERANERSLVSLRRGPWKVVSSQQGVESYALGDSPREEPSHEPAPAEIQDRLREFFAVFPPRQVTVEDLDEATLEHLRALGYVD